MYVGELTDSLGEQQRMLGSGEMAARGHADIDAVWRESLSRGNNLARFERVLLTACDVEGNGVAELAHKRREIPARVALMLVDEPRPLRSVRSKTRDARWATCTYRPPSGVLRIGVVDHECECASANNPQLTMNTALMVVV